MIAGMKQVSTISNSIYRQIQIRIQSHPAYEITFRLSVYHIKKGITVINNKIDMVFIRNIKSAFSTPVKLCTSFIIAKLNRSAVKVDCLVINSIVKLNNPVRRSYNSAAQINARFVYIDSAINTAGICNRIIKNYTVLPAGIKIDCALIGYCIGKTVVNSNLFIIKNPPRGSIIISICVCTADIVVSKLHIIINSSNV